MFSGEGGSGKNLAPVSDVAEGAKSVPMTMGGGPWPKRKEKKLPTRKQCKILLSAEGVGKKGVGGDPRNPYPVGPSEGGGDAVLKKKSAGDSLEREKVGSIAKKKGGWETAGRNRPGRPRKRGVPRGKKI